MGLKRYKVYCHTNNLNGKLYIGVTSQKLNRRFRNGDGYVNCVHFYRAINKYGWEEFTTKVLFDNLTKEQAEEKEIYLISKWNTLSPNGYNLESGGGLNKELSLETRSKIGRHRIENKIGTRAVNQYDMYHNLIKKWDSLIDVKRELGIGSSTIRLVCNRKNHHGGGFIWRYDDSIQFTDNDIRKLDIKLEWEESLTIKSSESKCKKVKCITTGIEFKTIREGADYYNIDNSSISKNCRGIINYSGLLNGERLVWRYL